MQELKEIIFFMYEHWCVTAFFLAILSYQRLIHIEYKK